MKFYNFFLLITALTILNPSISSANDFEIRSLSDVQSMVLRNDGKYDVICKNGSTEVVTAEKIKEDKVCGGGCPQPTPEIEAVFARSQGDYFTLCKNKSWQVATAKMIQEGNVCVGGALLFLGYADWNQDTINQSDEEQDSIMDQACNKTFNGSRAATVMEIIERRISAMPSINSNNFLVPKCPNCAGDVNPALKSGHARLCVGRGNPFPNQLPWSDYKDCRHSERTAMCVR